MGHDVFISYSTKDRHFADAVCHALESRGIRCWYAPRDIPGGADWPASIKQAILDARVMVYLLTENSRVSEDVTREVQHAFRKRKTVIPFRMEDTTANPSLEYYLEHTHWLDAFPPPLEKHLAELVEHVRAHLNASDEHEANESREAQPAKNDEMKYVPRRRSSRRSGRRWKLTWMVTAAIILGGATLRYVVHKSGTPKLTSRDTIVLAEFANSTGDAGLDGTLKQALAADLDQSPFFNILSDQQIHEQLRRMGKRTEERFSSGLAREVCLRTNGRAMLAGSIASLGTHYVIGLSALNCRTGEALVRVQREADAREKILKTLQDIVTTARTQLGESLSSIQQYDTPLEQATTSSLEALQSFALGSETQNDGNDAAAIPFYERAIALDTKFAAAFEALGTAHANLRENDLATRNLTAAYELRNRTAGKERLRIEAIYFHVATGNLRKAEEAYQLWAQTYLNAVGPHTGLATVYGSLGEHEKALAEMRRAAELSSVVESRMNVAVTLMNLERFAEAEQVFRQSGADPATVGPRVLPSLYVMAFVMGDRAEMDAVSRAGLDNSAAEDFTLFNQGLTEYYFGRSARAHELVARAITVASRNGQKDVARGYQIVEALNECELDETASARSFLAALATGKFSPELRVLEALALARSGDFASAQKLSDVLRKERPADTMLHQYWVPLVQASIELEKKQTARAIELLKPVISYDLSVSNSFAPALYPAYLRGTAFLQLRDGRNAAAEFQKLLDHRGLVLNSPLGALALLGKARALGLAGDIDKSKATYLEFLELWKDAEPGNKVLQQAKIEFGRLD